MARGDHLAAQIFRRHHGRSAQPQLPPLFQACAAAEMVALRGSSEHWKRWVRSGSTALNLIPIQVGSGGRGIPFQHRAAG